MLGLFVCLYVCLFLHKKIGSSFSEIAQYDPIYTCYTPQKMEDACLFCFC